MDGKTIEGRGPPARPLARSPEVSGDVAAHFLAAVLGAKVLRVGLLRPPLLEGLGVPDWLLLLSEQP
jgi:hypothetical protein